MREATEALCAAFTEAERGCFDEWCRWFDGKAKAVPDDVVASQAALHEAAARLRQWCLADRAAAGAERQELMARQAEGELAYVTAARERRPAQGRERARRDWNAARWAIICQRDALTCGLGWPHRGEWVTVSTWRDRSGERVPYTGAGIYLHSGDVFNVMHAVWMPVFGVRRKAEVTVRWLGPGEGSGDVLRGPADPAGEIGMRVQDAPGRPLPVPLERWPGYSASHAAAAPPRPAALFAAADVPARSAPPARPAWARRARPDTPARPPEEDLRLF